MSNIQSPDERYKDALDYLFSRLPMFSRIGAAAYKPGLDTSINLDNYFGNPHRRFKSIHVAGTNGKGSVSHTLAAMLQAQGYRTGLYTSPHLADFRERIRVNGRMIPEENVIDFVDRWKGCSYDGSPSFFELTMMMAFDWFARCEVDYAVIEVGMGGRLDSTNIITPEACIITNISPDHMQFLGNTLADIAREKAGIIKTGIPVVIGEAEGAVREVFEEKAREAGAPITFAQDEALLLSAEELAEGGWQCSGRGIDPATPDTAVTFRAELAGDYQKKNINTLLSAVAMLRERGITLSEESVRKGFDEVCRLTGLAGRWMRVAESPLTICDTGHNQAGLESNMAQLARLMSRRPSEARLRMVMGFVSDKDVDHILHLLPREHTDYYVTQASVPRAMPVERLAERFRAEGLGGRTFPTVKEAVAAARQDAAPDDIIYIGGSTFIVADFLTD